MYYDPYLSYGWYVEDDWDPRQIEFFPPIDETPPFQPPVGTPQFGRPPRPQRPRPPFFPPTTGLPWQDGSQGIRRCINQITMIMLNNGRNIWFYPTNITPQSVIGFRWSRNGWVRDSIERRNIRWFDCQ